MSLRISAPEFQSMVSQPSVTIAIEEYRAKDSHVISIPELGYEFPYTLVSMPLPSFHKAPPKPVMTEMITSVAMLFKRYS
jgi:hypothetical protein